MDELDFELDRFTPGAVGQALKRMARRGSGALLVTSGLRDVRLVVEAGRASVEAVGADLVGEEEPDLIRAFLCCLFWEDPTYFLDLNGAPIMSAPAIRLETDTREVLVQIGQGFSEMVELRERVPGLDVLVAVRGEPPPAEVDTPSANLFRVLQRSPGGGILLSAAEEAQLDAIDAAWAVSDLVDAEMATVKQPPPSLGQRRLRAAEAVAQDGLLPAVRSRHLALGFERADAKRAAHHHQEAGDGFLIVGRAELALEEYGACLKAIPNHPLALEGRIRALDALGRGAEAGQLHVQLATLYGQWALPHRTREHLEALPRRTPEQQDQLLNCMLLEQDFAAAEQQARGLIGGLDGAGRQALVARFGECGARGADLEAVVKLAGLRSARPIKRLAGLGTLAALLVLAALVGEVVLRQQFAIAARITRTALDTGRFDELTKPWEALRGYAQRANGVPFTCLAQVPPLLETLEALQADARLLDEPTARAAFAWSDPARWPDVREADHALEQVHQQAHSEALRAKVAAARAALEAYRGEVRAAVQQFQRIANRAAALRRAKDLLARYPNALDLITAEEVPLLVDVSPVSDATLLSWRVGGIDLPAASLPRGKFAVRLPVRPGAEGVLTVLQPDHVPQTHTVRLADLLEPELRITLVRWGPTGSDRIERPQVPPESGLIAVDTFRGERSLGYPLDQLTRTPSQVALEVLTPHLRAGQQLVVEVVSVVHAGGAVYLERFNLWLSDRSGRRVAPHKVDLSRKPVIPGVRRDVHGLAAGQPVLEPLDEVRGWEQIREALEYTLQQLQRELTQ